MTSLKYPRTYHVPWSLGATSDDKIAKSINQLIGQPIVITEKIDGSNSSLEKEGCFARTHSGPPTHSSFDNLKSLHANIKYKIPDNVQLFGENVFAVHSIEYNELPGYFLLFNVRDLNSMMWSSWEEVELWAQEIEVSTVPVLFKGVVSSEKELQKLTESFMIQPSQCGGIIEGIVVRLSESFHNDNFSNCVAKMVRQNHVTTDTHWAHKEVVKNKLKIMTKKI